MALILSVETATSVCSVALHEKGKLLAIKELHLDKSHAQFLVPIINDVLLSCGFASNDLQAIAFSQGPGSYTGLRIGSSTVKGLCYALNIPLISISTLEAMANQIIGPLDTNTLLCPMLDARRMEVYTALFDSNMQSVMEVRPVIIDNDTFSDYFTSNTIVLFGNGSTKCKDVIDRNAVFIDDLNPTSLTVGKLAYEKYVRKEFENIAYFEPLYLKEFRPTTPRMKSF